MGIMSRPYDGAMKRLEEGVNSILTLIEAEKAAVRNGRETKGRYEYLDNAKRNWWRPLAYDIIAQCVELNVCLVHLSPAMTDPKAVYIVQVALNQALEADGSMTWLSDLQRDESLQEIVEAG